MSRRRWLVLLGPPVLLLAVAPGGGPFARDAGAAAAVRPRALTGCDRAAVVASPEPGAWWRTAARLDRAGGLTGWTLDLGAGGARETLAELPAASTVTGPRGGLVVVASEPSRAGDPSIVRIVSARNGCAAEIAVRDRIVRRAVVDPAGDGMLAHLLAVGTRADLGVWRIGADGRLRERILEPLAAGLPTADGIERVWSTDLRLDRGGRRLAVQSCHPHGCLTRIVDLVTGAVGVIDGDHGPIVGWSSDALITWAACHGRPCDVLAWSLTSGGVRAGLALAVAEGVSGAGLAGDDDILLVRRDGPAGSELLSMRISAGMTEDLGAIGAEEQLLAGDAGEGAGLEVGPGEGAIATAGHIPTRVRLAGARP